MTDTGLRWTESQLEAIEVRGQNALVSAAAGSGKTAVLVERVIRLVTDSQNPVDIDRCVVVTFTEAAAEEMKSRLSDALVRCAGMNPTDLRLKRQMLLLDQASISTLHAFCSKVARKYFHELDIDPSFRVLDESEADLLQDDIIDRMIVRAFETDEGFIGLVRRFGAADGMRDLKAAVLRLYKFARSQVEPHRWIGTATARDGVFWAQKVAKAALVYVNAGINALEAALKIAGLQSGPAAYTAALRDDIDRFGLAAQCLDDLALSEKPEEPFDRSVSALAAGFGRLSAAKKCDETLKKRAAAFRETAKTMWMQAGNLLGKRAWNESHADLLDANRDACALLGLVRQFFEMYESHKRSNGVCDFSDLEHLCFAALKIPEVSRSQKRFYQEVLVDECQDISPIQEAILEKISSDDPACKNLFMVGDVKQSIYRFRLADPDLFTARSKLYSESVDMGRLINLTSNFRSTHSIIAFVNLVFENLFTGGPAELEYDEGARLVGLRQSLSVPELMLLDTEDKKNVPEFASGDTSELEAHMVARRIRQMLGLDGNEPVSVFDTETKRTRLARPGDFAVLLRSVRGVAEVYVDVLRRHGLPVYAELATGYFDATEIRQMVALLSTIDNPRQDIPLAAALRSPMFGFDAEALAEIRMHSAGDFYDAVVACANSDCERMARCGEFLAKLDRWRTLARRAPVRTLLQQIISETQFDLMLQQMSSGAQRCANLSALVDRARQFDDMREPGLQRFLWFIERLRARNSDLGPANSPEEGHDSIRVMSMHKSKGLEFPIVFASGLGRAWNRRDIFAELQLHKELGLGLLVCDIPTRTKYPSLAHTVMAYHAASELLAEEMRILYVALTRARDHLVLTGSLRGLDKRVENWVTGIGLAGLEHAAMLKATDYIDLLGPVLTLYPESGLRQQIALDNMKYEALTEPRFKVTHLKVEDLAGHDEYRADADFDKPPEPTEAADLRTLVERRLSWVYPYHLVVSKRAKVSASEAWRLSDNEDAHFLVEGDGFVAGGAANGDAAADRNGVDSTGAERGIATHAVFQHLDLGADVRSVRELERQVSAFVERGILTEEQARLVDLVSIEAFFRSELGTMIAAGAHTIERERIFTTSMPAHMLYPELVSKEGSDECIIVQGVIDCLLHTDSGLIVVDYKTDSVRPENVKTYARRYHEQMMVYAYAAQKITRKPIKECYLCFLAPRVNHRFEFE